MRAKKSRRAWCLSIFKKYAARGWDVIEYFFMRWTGEFHWLRTLRRYLLFMAVGNLIWEFAQMPLYTLWESGSAGKIVVAALHCTAGDILIAMSALLAVLFLIGTSHWPAVGYRPVALAAITMGIGYTVFSEWLNIDVRAAWAYSDLMPIIPVIEVGLSPLAQWIVLPSLAFWFAGSKRCAI